MPIATFGAELWILDDKSIQLLETFQVFVGRRIQRLFSKLSKASAYFSLGWICIERFIEIKKLLFVHSILSRNVDDITRLIFVQRARKYFDDIDLCSLNLCRSPVFDLLNTASTFGILDDVENMVYRGLLWSKAHWRDKIWKRAWQLEDVYWCIKARCHKSLELLSEVCINSRYIIWWQIADKFPHIRKDCEVMVKILCHASLFRIDDVRLKSLPIAAKVCNLCDQGAVDDANHMVMQCSHFQPKRTEMFNEIEALLMRRDYTINQMDENIFLSLMGKPATNISHEVMCEIWLCSVRHISSMYRMKLRQGIG